jgi:multiple sugar transport system permease protein
MMKLSDLKLSRTLRAEERRLGILMTLPIIILVGGLSLYPFASAVVSSFYRINTVTRESRYVGIGNYTWLFQQSIFWDSVVRSTVWIVGSLGPQLVLGIVISLLLDAEFHGRRFVRGIVLFPYMAPAVVAALIWRFMFNDTVGVVNYALMDSGLTTKPLEWLSSPSTALFTIILVGWWKYTPFMVIVLLARLQTVPPALLDAAKVDGANALRVFWHITLPWLRPVIIIALLLRTIWGLNEYDIVYLLGFGGPLQSTTTLPVLVRHMAFDALDLGRAAAVATVMAITLLVLSIAYFRFYRQAEEMLG